MKKKFKTLSLFFLLLLLLCNTTQASLEKNAEQDSASQTTHHFYMIQINGPLPPDQPSTGPGGSNYSHFGVRKSRYGFGGQRFWIFEPFGPKPESAPVIVFLHGFTAINPFIYREWIYHLVQRGNIVIYPRYQQWILRGSADYHPNAVNAVKQAITILQDGGHVQPELEKFAITGHSLGGGLTVSLAAVAEQQGLPIPKAIMPVQPFLYRIDEVNLSDICSETLMLVVVGEDDTIVGNQSGKIIFENTPQIPFSQKDFIIQVTDTYGSPQLIADHMAPLCMPFFNTVDAMDYYSTWKLFDALTDYAFYGINKEYCLGNTPEQRFMGLWSDGTPVKEMIVTHNP